MAAPANTYLSTGAKANREDLSDIVSRITPEDTPIYTMIEKGKAHSTNPTWLIDELAAPAANAQAEGDEYTFGATTPPVKVGNQTQIFRKEGVVSNTQEAVENAGDVEKVAEQKLKKGVEARRDVELSIVANTATVAGTTRVSGGLPSWLTTNVSRGAGGANGGYNQGTKLTVAATTGTQRALTKGLLDTVARMQFTAGGNGRELVAAPYISEVFSSFMSDANVASLQMTVPSSGNGKTILSGAVDVYRGPHGPMAIKPNRIMSNTAATARRALILDPDMLEWLWLRRLQEDKDIAKTGDNKKFVIIGEGTLKVKNEAAHASVEDIFGLSASS